MMHKLLKKFLENFNDISNFYSFLVAKTKSMKMLVPLMNG